MGPVRTVVVGALIWMSGGCRQAFGLDPPVGVDAPVADTRTDDTPIPCYGTGLVTYCPPVAPTQSVVLSGTIDTQIDPRCVIDKGNCVIAGDSIAINATFRAEGARPIVLVAVTTIDIAATLDVGSHRTFVGFAPIDHIGAGEASANCAMGNAGQNDASVGAGGGAGGSFGGHGGRGGAGGGGAMGGVSALTVAPGVFRAGCAGAKGGDGNANGGSGGHGGGAVYLIAASIRVTSTGAINAGGEGGYPGNMLSGGGGGGSGGYIGLDAPVVTNAGAIFTNGGGGGEGGGVNAPGDYGASSTTSDQAAGGGSINANAGNGGPGSFNTVLNGGDGGTDVYGGGGGGGGAGIIQLFQVTSVGGVVMPPPS